MLDSLEVRGRLKPGVPFARAREEVGLLTASLEQAYPATNRGYGMLLRTQFAARLEERARSCSRRAAACWGSCWPTRRSPCTSRCRW